MYGGRVSKPAYQAEARRGKSCLETSILKDLPRPAFKHKSRDQRDQNVMIQLAAQVGVWHRQSESQRRTSSPHAGTSRAKLGWYTNTQHAHRRVYNPRLHTTFFVEQYIVRF